MSKLSLSIPVVGEKNSTAEPKVDTAFSAIQTWANGEIEGTNNIKAEGVTEANLTAAVQALLNTKSFAALTYVTKNEATFTAATGELVNMQKNASTLTLPEPTANRIVGVLAEGTPITVICTKLATKIFGDFLAEAGVNELKLTKWQHIILQASGSNWVIMAGEPKREQTYEATKIVLAGGTFTPSTTRPAFMTCINATVWEVGGKAAAGSAFIVPPGQLVKNESAGAATVSVLIL